MPDQQKRCTTCKRTFYTKNLFDSTCPDCKRIAAANQQKHDNQKKLQDNQQRHERLLKEEELKHQKKLHEESRRFEKEQFKKQQRLEEYKLHEHRQLQEEHLTQAEIASIKDKVYNLALSSTSDTANISRLIRLLLQQHENHAGFIYKNIISIGSPFDTAIKEILSNQLRENIDNSYSDTNLSFQQKACKYFMPNFSGYEYDIFKEFLKNDSEFSSAVNNEIELAKTESEQREKEKLNEIEQLNQSVYNFNSAIQTDTSNYQSRAKKISLINILFGEQNTLFPRLNWYLVIGYVACYYYFDFKFSLYPFLILLAIGYVLSYVIIHSNRKSEEYNSEVSQKIRENEYRLRDIIENLEQSKNELKEQSEDDKNLIAYLNEYLQRV